MQLKHQIKSNMQIKQENKRKIISCGITIFFHVILILLLFVFGLPYQDPPPPEQGVEISAGELTDIGNAMKGDAGGDEAEEQVSEPVDNDEESVATQQESSPITAKPNKTKKENVKKETKPTVENDALFPGKNKNPKGNGNGSGSGYGNGENGIGGGGTGTNTTGGGYSLKGRNVKSLPKPQTNKNETGNVVVGIKVDQDGVVKEAHAGEKGTTIMDINIWRKCEQAARKARFSAKQDAPELQKGTITYHFTN